MFLSSLRISGWFSRLAFLAGISGWYSWLAFLADIFGWCSWLVFLSAWHSWSVWHFWLTLLACTPGWYSWLVFMAGNPSWYSWLVLINIFPNTMREGLRPSGPGTDYVNFIQTVRTLLGPGGVLSCVVRQRWMRSLRTCHLDSMRLVSSGFAYSRHFASWPSESSHCC